MSKNTVMITIVAMLVLAQPGCLANEYDEYVRSLPTHSRMHDGEAISVITDVYGIEPGGVHVAWVSDTFIIGRDGELLDGVTLLGDFPECHSWMYWHATGHATDAPVEINTDFATTSLAHEIAHCAMEHLTGDGDRAHADRSMWGHCDDLNQAGKTPLRAECTTYGWHPGLVDGAQAALAAAGL